MNFKFVAYGVELKICCVIRLAAMICSIIIDEFHLHPFYLLLLFDEIDNNVYRVININQIQNLTVLEKLEMGLILVVS